MRRRFAITGCLIWLLTPLLPAQQPQAMLPAPQPLPAALREGGEPLTLQRLEELADRYHPLLPRDRAQIEQARGQAIQAGLWSNPRFDTNNPQVFNGRTTLLNAGIQQEVPVMGKKRLDRAAANEVTRQQEINFFQDRIYLFTSIRQQFYQVLVDQRRIQVFTAMVEVLRRSHEMGEKKRRAGEATEADVLALNLDWQRAEASLLSTRALLDSDRKQLGDLVGIPGLIQNDVVGELSGDYPEFDEEQLRRYLLTRHSQVQIAQAVIAQAKVQLRRAEVEPVPNPYLGPSYQYGVLPGAEQLWFNIQFEIPVLNRNQGGIRAAQGNLRAAEENLTTIEYNLLNQGHNLIGQYRAAREIVRKFESVLLPNSERLLHLAQSGYSKGLTDFSVFLQFQRSRVQTNIDYLDALTNLWLNAAQLSGLLQMEKFR